MLQGRIVSSVLGILLLIFFANSGTALGGQVRLAWDQVSDPSVTGYKVHYGLTSHNYTNTQDVQNNLTCLLTNLPEAQPIYFAVTSYSSVDESDYSDELIGYTVQVSSPADGQILPAGTMVLAKGTSQTFSIVPDTGYAVSDVVVDGVSVGAVSDYTFSSLSACHTVSATFTTSSQTGFTISASAQTGGSIAPSGSVNVSSGTDQSFTISPLANYHIVDVQIDGASAGAVSTYTFSDVAANHAITAKFALNTYTLTPNSQANGSISPASAVTVNYGGSQTFTIIPNLNYKVSDVKVDGVSIGSVTSYTFPNVAANHTIAATYALNTYTITPTALSNGSISPASAVTVNSGANQTFTITPNSNYRVSDVKVDGVSVGAVTSYTFSNLAASHSIWVSFTKDTYTITATAQGNGSISPASAVIVNPGASKTFTIAANPGYKISDVKVDGVSVGAVQSYTFSNIGANHTITPIFSTASQLSAGMKKNANALMNYLLSDEY